MTLYNLYKLSITQLCTSPGRRFFDFYKIQKMTKPLLFTSLNQILEILENPKHKLNDGVPELLNIYEKVKEREQLGVPEGTIHPLIVLEGLDGCGKTSVVKRLAHNINAEKWKTPPESISHIRHLFDDHVELRTAYYSLGNYIAALEVQEQLKSTPVVMDRFWHSTAAYAIAQAVQDHPDTYKMPSPTDNIYCWPEDLFKPSIVLFLDVNEAVRTQRQSRRAIITSQEGLLNNSLEFRRNVIQAYNNMRNPGVKIINGNLFFKKVLAEIDETLKHLLKK